ncbi:MAG: FAD-dependent oxidoreductase [bacterium]|nr:FAD-dependent oxidoreductase [bacterium]
MNRRDFMKGAALAALTAPLARSASAASAGGGVVYSRTLPVKHEVDVFVAGGGPAGVAAAVSAARHGAKVFLAEGHTCLGGMSTAGRVMVFMTTSDGEHTLDAGFGARVRDRLKRESRIKGPANDLEAFKRVYDSEMTEAGVEFSFYTKVADVVAEGGEIQYVVCASPSGMWAVKAKAYIDCTGNGDLAVWAGAEWKKGDATGHMMPGTLVSYWDRLDWDAWRKNMPKPFPGSGQPFGAFLPEANRDKVLSVPDLHFSGIFRQEGGLGLANMGHCFDVDGTDEVSLTKALVDGRRSMVEYERYLHDYLKHGMEKARLLATGELLGIRETRRIVGDYVLSHDDYLARASFADEIGRYSYPIDIHPSSADPKAMAEHVRQFHEKYRYKKGESYGIPYRILTPKGMKNLLVAGRCVSSDEMVQASIRVIPACYITGQAAGIAASMAADAGASVHTVDVKGLQAKLRASGAYLPNA